MNDFNSKIVTELLRLKKERKEMINGTQKNIERNHQTYQEKMRKVQKILEEFHQKCDESDRNIVQPVKPIPQPFKKTGISQQGARTIQYLKQTNLDEGQTFQKKGSNHSSTKRISSKQRVQKIISK